MYFIVAEPTGIGCYSSLVWSSGKDVPLLIGAHLIAGLFLHQEFQIFSYTIRSLIDRKIQLLKVQTKKFKLGVMLAKINKK